VSFDRTGSRDDHPGHRAPDGRVRQSVAAPCPV